MRPDETAYVSKKGEKICFTIPEAEDYQPVYIAINPRGRPPGEQTFTQYPPLRVDNGWLCIPPSFYPFPDSSSVPFIVETILHSSATNKPARTFVAGVGLSNGRVYAVPLTNKEITR
ncbi:hypothetical protein GJV78_22180 [Escherichia alba]|uniref:DUF7480 domain-containing protein n=1 Tax=Intestinirhabdus alba TaxID=2899544 RepID=A0A6L6IVX3_9ENTR|nr:hypothetical protein [Intestinirhabdus alba]